MSCAAPSSTQPEDGELGSTSSALTSADVCRFEMIWRGSDGALHVNEVGPAGQTCLATSTTADCSVIVDRVDLSGAGLTLTQRQATLTRIESSTDDSAFASTLFHGAVRDVLVRDHRTGTTSTKKRYFADGVFFAPDTRTHSREYFYLFDTSGYQKGYSIGHSCRSLPTNVNLSWSSAVPAPRPRGVLDDVIVTGVGSRADTGFAIDLVGDQYFVRQVP